MTVTTRPQQFDPVDALPRHDGTTATHWDDHGRVIDAPYNAKHWLRGDGVTEGTDALDDMEGTVAGKALYLPPGTYKMPDGRRFFSFGTTPTQIISAGVNAVNISVKDEYAFQHTSGNLSNVDIGGFTVTLRAGSVVGGAVKAWAGGGYHSGWTVHDIDVEGVSTNTNTGVWVNGFIGSTVRNVRVANNGGHGIWVDSNGFVSNVWRVENCTLNVCGQAAPDTYAGLYVANGGSSGTVTGCDFESNYGRGIWIAAGGGGIGYYIHRNWFEDNHWTSVYAADCGQVLVEYNQFQEPHNPEHANTRHVHFEESSATRGNYHRIANNQFYGPNNGGVGIEIGTNVTHTRIDDNRGSPEILSNIIDNGFYTTYLQTAAETAAPLWAVPIDTSRGGGLALRKHGSTAASSPQIRSGSSSPEGVITAPVGSIYLRTDGGVGTSIYQKTSGVGNTGWAPAIAASPSSAYTVTNPTTDRALNVTADTLPQVAEVLGTLIADLQAAKVLG